MFLDDLIYELERIKYNYGGDIDVKLNVAGSFGSEGGWITDLYILETTDAQYKLVIESKQLY